MTLPRDRCPAATRNWSRSRLLVLVGIPVLPLLIFAAAWLGMGHPTVGFVHRDAVGLTGMTHLIIGVVLFGAIAFLFGQPSEDRGPLAVILILAFIGNIFFWTAFEQAGSSLNVFAKEQTDLTLWGLIKGGIPASFFQSVNPLTILLFGPVFSWLWLYLERKKKDPSTPMKFAIGLWLLGLGFVAMVFGAIDARDGLAGAHWLLITYMIYTWGELCLSPVGLVDGDEVGASPTAEPDDGTLVLYIRSFQSAWRDSWPDSRKSSSLRRRGAKPNSRS